MTATVVPGTPPAAPVPRRSDAGSLRGIVAARRSRWCWRGCSAWPSAAGRSTRRPCSTCCSDPDGSDESIIVHDLRIPRTVLGLIVGMALGVAGALMQGHTRNPLADPGLLGVAAGAAFAVVLGISSSASPA